MLSRRDVWLVLLPIGLVYLAWLWYMEAAGQWGLFRTDWYMTATMVVGSIVAGASSEGGGAIAYPVMTLVFDIDPAVARNFSLAIQSVGMSAATLWIVAHRIPIEARVLRLAGLGGIVGVVGGAYGVAPHVPPAYAKMMFVSFWLAYGIALFVINHVERRGTLRELPDLDLGERAQLVMIGLVGGVLSAVFGNGIDICTFSYVTLRYRLSEKVATPTSVALMAGIALVGAVLHAAVLGDMQARAVDFWLVSIPVVVLGAPFGAWVVSKVPRLAIAGLLYSVILVQFVTASWIVQPAGALIGFSAAVFAFGLFIFFWLARRRRRSSDG